MVKNCRNSSRVQRSGNFKRRRQFWKTNVSTLSKKRKQQRIRKWMVNEMFEFCFWRQSLQRLPQSGRNFKIWASERTTSGCFWSLKTTALISTFVRGGVSLRILSKAINLQVRQLHSWSFTKFAEQNCEAKSASGWSGTKFDFLKITYSAFLIQLSTWFF